MPKETAAQKRSRIADLLRDYDNRSRELRKLQADVKSMKEQIHALESGTYLEMILTRGTPREIMDQQAVKEGYTKRGELIPTKMTDAPIVVSAVAK